MLSRKYYLAFILFYFLSAGAFAQSSTLAIQHWQTQNGTPVYFIQAPQLPMLDIALAFNAGAIRDGKSPGLAHLTLQMLGQATAKLSADEIADQFDNLGAVFNTAVSRDMALVSLRTLTKPEILNPATQLFTDVIATAKFPDQAFQREKRNTLQAILSSRQMAANVANQTFFQAIYGDYPYGHPIIGDTDSVKQINRENVSQFYHQYFTAQNTLIAMVGDLSRQQAEKLANCISAALPQGQKAPALADAKAGKARQIRVDFPGTQTYIRLGSLGIKRSNPDYFPLLLANQVLGGGMVSRLFTVVREHYGLSYAVGSNFLALAYRGPFIISLQTKNAETDKALTLTRHVVEQFVSQGITQQELQEAKDYLTGSFPVQIDSNLEMLNALINMGFYQLPLDYLNTYKQKINQLTLQQVNTAIRQYIKPHELATVIVGGHEQEK